MLAQQYCNECKSSFEELSKIIQRVLVSRKELVSYDAKHRDIDPPLQLNVKLSFVFVLLMIFIFFFSDQYRCAICSFYV